MQDKLDFITLKPLSEPVIDHDHETGLFRGVLNNVVNLFLGFVDRARLLFLDVEGHNHDTDPTGTRAVFRAICEYYNTHVPRFRRVIELITRNSDEELFNSVKAFLEDESTESKVRFQEAIKAAHANQSAIMKQALDSDDGKGTYPVRSQNEIMCSLTIDAIYSPSYRLGSTRDFNRDLRRFVRHP